jgi:hypothetical protein
MAAVSQAVYSQKKLLRLNTALGPWVWTDNAYSVILLPFNAQMAELVDASDSKSGSGNRVQVRFLFWAQGRR